MLNLLNVHVNSISKRKCILNPLQICISKLYYVEAGSISLYMHICVPSLPSPPIQLFLLPHFPLVNYLTFRSWNLQRNMLEELARYAFCVSLISSTSRSRSAGTIYAFVFHLPGQQVMTNELARFVILHFTHLAKKSHKLATNKKNVNVNNAYLIEWIAEKNFPWENHRFKI